MDFDIVNAQSYIPSFDILYKNFNIKRVLEFGEGCGTKYLLDKSDFVCSVEVVANSSHLSWAKYCEDSYQEYSDNGQWKQIVIQCNDTLKEVDKLCQKGILTDISEYQKDLSKIIEESFKFFPYDMAFVDYGIHMRADIVNMLFNKVNIICAHDTNVSPDMYGWNRIIVPERYTKVVYSQDYLGTTFWIKK